MASRRKSIRKLGINLDLGLLLELLNSQRARLLIQKGTFNPVADLANAIKGFSNEILQ